MSPLRQAGQWWLPCGWLELRTCLHRRADRARLSLACELCWAKCRGDPRYIFGQSDVWPIPSVVSTPDRAGKSCCFPFAMMVILPPVLLVVGWSCILQHEGSPLSLHSQFPSTPPGAMHSQSSSSGGQHSTGTRPGNYRFACIHHPAAV